MKLLLSEGVLSITLIVLALLFLDPFMLLMPTEMVYVLIAGVTVAFATFATFVWRERSEDERDEYHKMLAARLGYLLGAGVLLIGIIWQTLTYMLDPWLVYVLLAMIFGKLLGRYYGTREL